MADLARMEDTLAASGLGWTVVRPPQLAATPVWSQAIQLTQHQEAN